MAICRECNKFAAYDTGGEPEAELNVSSVEEDSVTVSGSIRIVLTSECCSDELREANFDIEETVTVERAEGCKCDDFEAEFENGEITDRMQTHTERVLKSGEVKKIRIKNSRYAKRFYGAAGDIVVTCSCGQTSATVTWDDEVQASGMDEI
jgi:hypothetical protein